MKIKKLIKIAAHKVRIRLLKNITLKGFENALGYADLYHDEIVIRKEFGGKPLPEPTKAEVFMHEILHMLAQLYGIKIKEQEVNQLAAGLLQVIRDNKLNFLDEGE